MALTQKTVRNILRWSHIILGLAILCYIYSPFHSYVAFQIFIKFVAIPIIVISGIWMWKFQKFNKMLNIQ